MGGSISKNNTRTNITIPIVLKNDLQEIAKQERRSFNNLVIKVLEDYVSQLRSSEGKFPSETDTPK